MVALLLIGTCPASTNAQDWLIDNQSFKTKLVVGKSKKELLLTNGIVTRTFRTVPNLATVAITNKSTSENLIRAVRPEAVVTIDGKEYSVGGLHGQPNQAFLKRKWLDEMKNRCQGFPIQKLRRQ